LWEQKPKDIIKCLEELENEMNVMFLNPISLRCMIENNDIAEKFCALHFSRGTNFKWRNDVGQDVDAATAICNFLNLLNKSTKSNIGAVPFKLHLSNSFIEDFKRILLVSKVFKINKIHMFFAPENLSILNSMYKYVNDWCAKGFKNSFIENMVLFSMGRKGKRWYQIINDPIYWGQARVKQMIDILNYFGKDSEFLTYMCIQWGTDSLDASCIDFEIIQKFSNSLI
jgi:hypothetical protein